MRRGLLGSPGAYASIDGWTRVLPWGTAILEVPADRPVMISVHQTWMAGLATTTLMPHDPPVLEYRSPRAATFPGELGAPGTTRARGGGWLLALLVAAPALVAIPVLLAIVFLLLQ